LIDCSIDFFADKMVKHGGVVVNIVARGSRGYEFDAWPLRTSCPVKRDGLNSHNNCDIRHAAVLGNLFIHRCGA